MIPEQRRSERYSIQGEIEIERADVRATGTTENLSLGGAMLRVDVDEPWKMDEEIGVRFRLPDLKDPVSARALVRWVSDVDAACIGIQFTTGFRAQETWAMNKLFDRLRSGRG